MELIDDHSDVVVLLQKWRVACPPHVSPHSQLAPGSDQAARKRLSKATRIFFRALF